MAESDQMPVLHVPPDVLRRYAARLLDPVTAPPDPTRKGSDPTRRGPGPTAYLTTSLLVRGLPGPEVDAVVERLQEAADRAGRAVRLVVDPAEDGHLAWFRRVGEAYLEELQGAYQTRVLLAAPQDGSTTGLDPWELLTLARADGRGPLAADLEHLVLAAGGEVQGGGGYWGGHGGGGGYWGGHGGGGGYWGGHHRTSGADDPVPGRTPLGVSLPDPSRDAPKPARAPVVAVPDTGIGAHPWFEGHPGVRVTTDLDGMPVGPEGGLDPDPEGTGVRHDLTGELDALSGHGTFIAGVVRQAAPSARILALPVMDSGGAASEHDVHRTLTALWVSHARAQDEGRQDDVVDVLSVSMGFYHQDGTVEEHPVRSLMDLFARRGVLVVAAAGNDATRWPLYPAGWAAGGAARPASGPPPLVSVGALNPDGRTVALFSNAGSWVTTHRVGVNVVSTLPTTFQAAAQAGWATEVPEGHRRATLDADDHAGGFAVWSGTSFAAPLLAGQLAAHVARAKDQSPDPASAVKRAWDALDREIGWSS